MDCYFHSNVPSVAPCSDCHKPICATCRDERGSCPSCRLAAKVDAATMTRQRIAGQVPPRPHVNATPPPPPSQPVVRGKAEVAAPMDPVESRAIVALGYPLWPLAALSLFDRKQSRQLRRAALQALGFNIGFAAFGGLLTLLMNIPILGISAGLLLPFLIPAFLVASVYFGVKTWNGDDVRVPIVADWIDRGLPIDPEARST